MSEKNCPACASSYMGPGDDELVCGHEDSSAFGKYARIASSKGEHCGPTRPKFTQHPHRHPDGTLMGIRPKKPPPRVIILASMLGLRLYWTGERWSQLSTDAKAYDPMEADKLLMSRTAIVPPRGHKLGIEDA